MAAGNSTEQPSLFEAGKPEKRCPKCKLTKPLDGFSIQTIKGRRRRSSWCIECKTAYNVEWLQRHPDRRLILNRRSWLKKLYGISPEDYDTMCRMQGGGCAICGVVETRKARGKVLRLAVDHDHATGEVRALLCNACNNMIGHAREDPAILRAGAKYLEVHGKHASQEANV